jgi:hypothetical protein
MDETPAAYKYIDAVTVEIDGTGDADISCASGGRRRLAVAVRWSSGVSKFVKANGSLTPRALEPALPYRWLAIVD